MTGMSRRRFLGASAAALAVPMVPDRKAKIEGPKSDSWHPRKAVLWSMLPTSLSPEERFRLARDCGFDGVEVPPVGPEEAAQLRAAADKTGIRIHSIIFGGWEAPLSSADPAVVTRGSENVRNALHSAQIMGCDGILLVPAIVNAQTPYEEAYRRSQAAVRKLLPEAERRRVSINIEEVWNNFLLSPLEFRRYVDELHSPWVGAYFDVGNVVRFGWPQDWIRTLGHRIRKVHLKDFKGGPGLGTGGQWVNLLEGSIDWKAVRAAFMDVGYEGFMTTELGGGDAEYLKDVSARVDRIIAG